MRPAMTQRPIRALLERQASTTTDLEHMAQALQLFLRDFCRTLTPAEETHRQTALNAAAHVVTVKIPGLRQELAVARALLGVTTN
jgi:hypothetical protein